MPTVSVRSNDHLGPNLSRCRAPDSGHSHQHGGLAGRGKIGPLSKRRRFEKRYRQQGMSQALIGQLVCPIGVDGISGKKPAEIAVAVAAEILKIRERAVAALEEDYPDNVQPLRS